MHFTVLSALPLPQDTSTAMNAVTVDDVVSFVAGKLLLENLASQKPVKMPEVGNTYSDARHEKAAWSGYSRRRSQPHMAAGAPVLSGVRPAL